MCAEVTVIIRVCKPVRLLQLLVVPNCVCKCSINPITNPKPVYSVTHTRDSIFSFNRAQSGYGGPRGGYNLG
jgi:hypothetical protein